ncbi:isoleucyl-tRNA synthetase [Candidatus Liberibacter solanacearum CLso-ZC1]|uniref:Isoleucine--tRNA ligase n=1 Tax=Liberibacter solanacearum (strain CLso-ZC1) TaxID=658172 RepID=E4UCL7_LIBSC|nr:isoleucine--tRNA ligase [Candidatus Liberibacter solanacearum]ADR52107.1 isoleucyl-tRNA synthetase [Candidatus Liberibacter solanacearum CLso-ZC1]
MNTSQKPNYSSTLFLPKTDFPMRAQLPQKEPKLIAHWKEIRLFDKLRENAVDRKKFVLHDGPPYANGHLHIGHALNKILKDVVVRSFQMRGFDACLVPGWDCHGLPIEWKVESEYLAQGKNKDIVPVNEFRQECRNYAREWVKIQSEEFERLGVVADFENPYTTMDNKSESLIASELLKFATTHQIYRGVKPVMWSIAEQTTLAEAEIEYHNVDTDSIVVGFSIKSAPDYLREAQIVIWTTTPWTIPGNRAIAFSSHHQYGLYKVLSSDETHTFDIEKNLVLSKNLAQEIASQTKITIELVCEVKAEDLSKVTCSHPLEKLGYTCSVPLIDADYVANNLGTGFVHVAPSHGVDDFDIWNKAKNVLQSCSIDTRIPSPVDERGFYTKDAPGFVGARVLDDMGEKGNANEEVIIALINAHALLNRQVIKHLYPHSWRSKKPIIFRAISQWFIHVDKKLEDGKTLRSRALGEIDKIRFFPSAGKNRLRSMIEQRPDWVLSRQRHWGVPVCLFFNEEGEILLDESVNRRIIETFKEQGSDAWFAENIRDFFLGERASEPWIQSMDILDVWFDSACTHAITLEENPKLQWPANVYLEGSDQHRGWFQHSLLESCATRGSTPFTSLITHGFAVDENGEKMSKSKGNVIFPDTIISESGADILRFWVVNSDYHDDQRLGKNIIQTNIDAYRKLRNTIRWMLGVLAHDTGKEPSLSDVPELERFILHRITELDQTVREAYDNFDFKTIVRTLMNFSNFELSSFYFDIRKDSLYCDSPSSLKRLSSIAVIRKLCRSLILWLAPMLPFTAEEAWSCLESNASSVHLEQFPTIPTEWKDAELSKKWNRILKLRKVVTSALEIERKEKRIGSSLETSPILYITDSSLIADIEGQDLAEICITSDVTVVHSEGPSDAFRLLGVSQVSIECKKAIGKKCARSWRITQDVGSDSSYPDVSARDAAVLHELGYPKN